MIIVAGFLTVDPADRDAYLTSCVPAVQAARTAPGCLDFALSADPLDDSRINVFERWESRDSLETFRGSGPSPDQRKRLLAIRVDEFEAGLV